TFSGSGAPGLGPAPFIVASRFFLPATAGLSIELSTPIFTSPTGARIAYVPFSPMRVVPAASPWIATNVSMPPGKGLPLKSTRPETSAYSCNLLPRLQPPDNAVTQNTKHSPNAKREPSLAVVRFTPDPHQAKVWKMHGYNRILLGV